MSAQLIWRTMFGMEVLHLGEIAVGRVCRHGGRNNSPRWMFNLEPHIAFWHSEKTIEQCKAAVAARMQNWLERAGLT